MPRLLRDGWRVTAVTRHAGQPRVSPNLDWIQHDLYNTDALLATTASTLFSVGPLDGLASWLARTKASSIRHVIAIGSMSAVVKAFSPVADERALAGRLRKAETSLRQWGDAHGARLVILRPTLIYGGGTDQTLGALFRFARRWRIYPLVPGAHGLRQPIHADDVAAACVAARRSSRLTQQIYGIGGAETLPYGEMLDRHRAGLGFRTLPIPIPLRLASAGLAAVRLLPQWRHLSPGIVSRLNEDLDVDNQPAMNDLDWQPSRFRVESSGRIHSHNTAA